MAVLRWLWAQQVTYRCDWCGKEMIDSDKTHFIRLLAGSPMEERRGHLCSECNKKFNHLIGKFDKTWKFL